MTRVVPPTKGLSFHSEKSQHRLSHVSDSLQLIVRADFLRNSTSESFHTAQIQHFFQAD